MVDKEDEEKENDGKKKAESIRLPTAPAQGAVKSGGCGEATGIWLKHERRREWAVF